MPTRSFPRLTPFLLALATMIDPSALSAQTSPPLPPAAQAAWRGAADHFHARMDEEGIVGGSFFLVRGGAVVAKEVHGFADLDTRRAVDDNTIYHWASITKTLTGLAILQLRDRGLLDLDDPVVRWVPELREVHDPFGPIEDITVRHVLSHSAGFRASTWPWGGGEEWHPHEPTRWSQLVAMMPYTEVLFEPGSRFSYSNPAIIFLGRIIEALSGDDFEVYVQKNILAPLGMDRSYFDVTPYHLLPYRSNNYAVTDGHPVAGGFDFDTGITVSNGGFNAPLTDMARYLAFLTGGCPDAACASVLERSSLEEMWRPQVPLIAEAGTSRAAAPDAWDGQMGLTWFLYARDGRNYVGHTGSQKAFISFVYLDPTTGAAAVGAFNTVGSPHPATSDVLLELRQRLFDQVFPALAR